MNERVMPPGETTDVPSLVTVVLAPHYDDEVLGCGGLLARLARGGTRIHVVFLSDGSGGAEAIADRAAYAARRRAESEEAGRVLGVATSEHLGLVDGSLSSSLDQLRAGIERALVGHRPDLVLSPSPLEITGDHQAAFAALHDLLTALREGDPRHAALAETTVLLYEVNHPAHPDLLIDVTRERATLETAMACYASQLERHDYLGAAIGLRRYRCLTLGPSVELAEAYRRLRLDDFRTLSRAGLIGALGGAPALDAVREGPLVSVVVRTRDRPALLRQALESLAAGTYRAVEVVLVNDGGTPPRVPQTFPFPVRAVELQANRGRAAAANAGVAAAGGRWVVFLDDDDLVAPEHLETLVGLALGSGERVVYTDAAVGVYEADERGGWSLRERSLPYSRDFDPDLLLVDNYIPFHTLLIERSLHDEVGAFDESLQVFEDWDLLVRMSRVARFHHLPRVTCEYRHFRGGAHALGEAAENRAGFLAAKARVIDKHRESLGSEALARAVVTLRREAVEARRRAEDLRARLSEMERRYHLTNGELESVREESTRRARALDEHTIEFRRRFEEEASLRRGIDEQLEHLGRTYAEIERLNQSIAAIVAERDRTLATIEAMKATRAWRLHEWWQRLRS